MSWRISLYCVPKKTVEEYREITQEDYDKSDKIFETLEKECVMFDTLTDIIGYSKDRDKFSTKLFKNNLEIENDMYFGTISKQQLLDIILEVRENHIIKWFDGRRIDAEDKLGEAWNDKVRPVYAPNHLSYEPWKYEDALLANQGEWNYKADRWKSKWFDDEENGYHYMNINLDLNNKWKVSDGFTYEYLIFDLIHILKIFDWEKDELVCIGG